MNRSRWIAVAVIAVVLVGGLWLVRGRGHKDQPRYRTAELERGDLTATVSATGTVKPVVQVQVGSQVSGMIQSLNADYNSRVSKGQILAQIEPSSFQTRVTQAEASVAHAEAALADGQRSLARSKELIQQNYIAQADVDAAQATADQRAADLKQAKAALSSAQVDLEHTTIRSPIDGVVISRSVDVGQTVAASLQAPQLFVIANDLTQMQVETSIDEADIGRIRAGLPVTFTVDAFPDESFEGTVAQVRLEPITQQNVVTYTTVIRTRNNDLRLRPGMTANVTVDVETRHDVLKVANAALRVRPAGLMFGRGGFGGGAGGARGGPGGGGAGGGGSGGGVRRGFAWLIGQLAPATPAYAQPGPGAGPGWNDPFVQHIRDQVQKGELTRDQAREMIRNHFAQMRGAAGGPGATSGAPARADSSAAGGTRRGGRGGRPGASLNWPSATNDGHGGGSELNPLGAGPTPYKPGVLWLLRGGQPSPVRVLTGITDGSMTEIRSDTLQAGMSVIVGLEIAATGAGPALAPPPGMGGPTFRGPRPAGRGR